MQAVLDWANNNSFIVISGGVFLVEGALRIFKTEEPKSLLIMLAKVLRIVADVTMMASKILDGVVQRLK